jgi:hypothetical protein
MSEPLRVALVAEGPTDKVVLESALTSMLAGRSFIFRQLQPEESLPFGEPATGWVGVHNWCRSAVKRSDGALRKDILYNTYDILILQLDADVADKTYASGNIPDQNTDLPCRKPCPPPEASTNPLRKVLLRWAGETSAPPKTVLCTPSKSMEAWVVAALFPNDTAVRHGIECWDRPEIRLGQQPANRRIQKRIEDYESHFEELKSAWPNLAATLTQAGRFENEFLALVPS